jgi:hypothetical protein
MLSRHLQVTLIALCSLLAPLCMAAQDDDKAKLIAIEEEYAAPPAGPPTPMQKYMYPGPVMALAATGRVNITSKDKLLANQGRPNTADPDVKRHTQRTNYHVELYGDTALISYSQTVTETGHRDPALNVVRQTSCLDTFVKRDGSWYGISNACAPATSPPAGVPAVPGQ